MPRNVECGTPRAVLGREAWLAPHANGLDPTRFCHAGVDEERFITARGRAASFELLEQFFGLFAMMR